MIIDDNSGVIVNETYNDYLLQFNNDKTEWINKEEIEYDNLS